MDNRRLLKTLSSSQVRILQSCFILYEQNLCNRTMVILKFLEVSVGCIGCVIFLHQTLIVHLFDICVQKTLYFRSLHIRMTKSMNKLLNFTIVSVLFFKHIEHIGTSPFSESEFGKVEKPVLETLNLNLSTYG